ncbi:DUF6597 domain-containing transcriptional factor [Paraflavitalea sp. CAU 1676]|uniref:DUF6597 domain-containing transcriptional factor n=1 Tax=Paraflavitalea sp. CAU 1676 TaxID=3032598 RepID=UPI0023DC9D37|nr:DUF6597 domain-containing transcriptional factor [Paraflavitalea sp. CAU 1676]MDF2190676.1 helix-turn-helix domain-containing protein [Paraflavitalea sp. CAU 1676]
MMYREYKPGPRLKEYVKCYYIYESNSETTFEDTVFPSGNMEIIFNLGSGQWQTAPNETFLANPAIELWGQIVKPLPVRSIGQNTMLGVRLYPQAAAFFLKEKVDLFNNQVADFSEVVDKAVQSLHSQLMDTGSWSKRIELLDNYLFGLLNDAGRRLQKIAVVNDVMQEMKQHDFFDNIENVAARYGITSRYLQKLFVQYTGLTPKLYSKIHRFQNSLRLVSQKESSLTSIAYDCGYFDQSHFIREFKSFTGYTPSGYSIESSPVTLALASN